MGVDQIVEARPGLSVGVGGGLQVASDELDDGCGHEVHGIPVHDWIGPEAVGDEMEILGRGDELDRSDVSIRLSAFPRVEGEVDETYAG